ncbi:MAG: response regulator [Spartobacteria bacterium]|nr:response regulator [Spartobacteria bacterium]
MKKILIVEDEEMLLCAVMRFMARRGHEPVACRTSEDMRREWANGPFDAVICDVNIPGGGSLDILRDILAEGRPFSCIIVSADYPDEPCDALMGAHANVLFCMKPYDLFDLLALIEQDADEPLSS